MDALVYEDSPLAEYLEGEGLVFQDNEDTIYSETSQPSFAPKGGPSFTDRIRKIRNSATALHPQSSGQIIEQFRYIIVASQLLSDEAPPRPVHNDSNEHDKGLLRGAVATGLLSFIAAWTLHWLRSRTSSFSTLSWLEVSIYCLASFCGGVVILLAGRRQYSKYVQKAAASSLTGLVNEAQGFDTSIARTVRFIQEIELVSRGYELSTPLPPVSRLEESSAVRRCQALRTELAKTLILLITLYVEGHNVLQNFVVQQDLHRYHDIYEVSLVEYSDAIQVANALTEDARCALKELRFTMRLHAVARKVFLCDLLALRSTIGWHRVRQWKAVLVILRHLEEETILRQQHLDQLLHDLEFGSELRQLRVDRRDSALTSASEDINGASHQYRNQLQRFDDVAQGIRAVNAKLHIMREEIAGLKSANTDDSVVTTALSKHYDALGTDIRALQVDWERGRNAMRLAVNPDFRSRPGSLSPRTPVSPSPSYGGVAIGDGGPAEALRALNGDDRSSRSSDATLYDEEVFEAVSKPMPRQRMSLSAGLTREEKIAKLNEERKKRATMAEHADTTTNMLRELKMVIKHRPHNRTSSSSTGARITSV